MSRMVRRGFLKWLHGLKRKRFDMGKAAEAVSSSNVILAGLLWATFLAAFVSSSDEDGFKEPFGWLVVLTSFLFVVTSWVQIFQALEHTNIVGNAVVVFISVVLSLISLGLKSNIGACLPRFKAAVTASSRW